MAVLYCKLLYNEVHYNLRLDCIKQIFDLLKAYLHQSLLFNPKVFS